ncbi:MAG: hypothetical protein CK429_23315 [Mycobacterium sp.]|uniref:DUF6542 domain-containing protein n=1 Tax=Mycobacterium gordonae TaxID=1778 RepID=A0A1A6B8J8_MYCGO|nr:DUF6542 domain-containing protein [Mycobacterium gordonae]MBI2701691.1 hypothetical protein [Mycobacterium sp.]OBR98563.1 hypothetical protein A9W98_34710 [Mycobacterium gordonae]PJE08741.1 MAG: hypothetical protein CK429_23315 [Mycobacterium sp.]
MSAQRERAAVEPSRRSIVPSIPGVPWWAAVLIAVGATALGYAFDAGHKELTHTFAGLYIAGCVAAVLAVRQAAVFTAVIQPPLILFITVPGAYWLFHGGKVDKFKDLLINCGYPLIERFPLMLGTAGLILLIGLVRWYFGKNSRTLAEIGDAATPEPAAQRPPLLSGLIAKLSTLLAGGSDDDADAANTVPPAHSRGRAARSSRTARNTGRTAQRPARSRSRHARPDDTYEPGGERPRRTTRRGAVPPTETTDYDRADAPPRPRRRRPDSDSDLGAYPPREMRREPHPRRSSYDRPRPSERPSERPYERPEPRSSRFNPYDTYERPEPSERGERRSRHERRGSGYEPYPPYEPPYEPRSRRTNGSGNANPTHHPISQVRYRGQPPRSEPRDERREEPRSDRRTRSRAPRRPQTETWDA